MHRDQFDFGARIWSIPAAGMKLGRARHRQVPMSDPAIEELKDMLAQQGIDVSCETNKAWTSQVGPRAAAKISSRHRQHSDWNARESWGHSLSAQVDHHC
jgi:hypothetical protein